MAAHHTAYLAHYSRFELPSSSSSINPEMILPIQPGIFKGTTKSNGIQLFLLSYKDGNKVIGRKITVYMPQNFIKIYEFYNLFFSKREMRIFQQEEFLSKLILAAVCILTKKCNLT